MSRGVWAREATEWIIKEPAIFMMRYPHVDRNRWLCQLQNCVLALQADRFRLGRPSDMRPRDIPAVVP